ncbi:MAG: tyrosine-type recombinase/integrase [Candidatus Nanopelagicales bacterium]
MKRIKAKGYKGTYYIIGTSPASGERERIYYIRYRDPSGKLIEEKVGRATVRRTGAEKKGEMTALDASNIRADRMRGREPSNEERREAIRAEKAAEAGRWTLSRLFEEYEEQHPGKKLANEKSRFKNYLAPTFGDKEPAEIAPLDVDRLRVNLLKKRKPATVFAILELFRRLVNFGTDRRLCSGLPFKVTMPEVNNLKTEDLNAAQMARLLKVLAGERLDDDPPDADTSVDPDARDVVRMVLFTGMRRGEILGVKWEDVDTRRGFFTIRNPKGGKDATIPLSVPAREVLEGRTRTDSVFVFPGRKIKGREEDRPRENVKRALEKIRTRAKLPPGFRPLHGLRHHFGSSLVSSGVDLYTVQRLLTHKSPAMTMRYAHLRDDALRAAADLAGRIISEAEATEKKTERGNG